MLARSGLPATYSIGLIKCQNLYLSKVYWGLTFRNISLYCIVYHHFMGIIWVSLIFRTRPSTSPSKSLTKGRAAMPLNDLRCKNAKPKTKAYKLLDRDGLYLYVSTTGKRFWRFRYLYLGKDKILSIGVYPNISLSEARRIRDQAKSELDNGKNPNSSKREAKKLLEVKTSGTFQAIAEEWHSKYNDSWSEKQSARILRRLKNDLFPDLGNYQPNELTPQILLACLHKAEERSPELAHRLLGFLGKIFRYAGLTGRIDKDVTMGLKEALKRPKTSHFACIEIEQLPDFITPLYDFSYKRKDISIIATKLLMLLLTRTVELSSAERSEFNLENALWVIPALRMKMKKDHLVPLSRQSIEILKQLDSYYGEDRKYLFPSPNGRRDSKPVCKHIVLKGLSKINFTGIMTGHGFRSLAMSIGTECMQFPHHVIDRQLAHAPKGTVMRAYDRAKYLPQRKDFMQAYADYLDDVYINQKKDKERNDRIK